MENISIRNSALTPQLAQDWVLSQTDDGFELDNSSKNERFEINAAAGHIVSLCDGVKTLEQIIVQLQEMYPESAEDIQGDVEAVLKELLEHEVITFSLVKQEATTYPIQERTGEHEKRRLCIGMATYDDYDGVYFSIQAIRLFHPEVVDQLEFVVIDNHPDGPCADALKKLESWVSHYRYIPCDSVRGTAIRDVIFREANADFVLCMDSHVFMAPGSLARLLEYSKANPNSRDLLQGPLLNDDMQNLSSHFKPEWSGGMYGTWGLDERAKELDGKPFDIPSQGLGIFCCAKEAWLGFNSRFAGFGGEEGYIHEKFRQAGRRTLCLPFLRWLHRFNRPLGTRYPVSWDDRIRNYMIGLIENKLPITDMQLHFEELIGEAAARSTISTIQIELDSPLYYFDAIYCVRGNQAISNVALKQYASHGISRRLKIIEYKDTSNPIAKAHLQALEEAGNLEFEHLLVLHAGVKFPDSLSVSAGQAIAKLADQTWEICILQIDDAANVSENNCVGIAYRCNAYSRYLTHFSDLKFEFYKHINNTKHVIVIKV